ncbi:Trans-1,2-dihydrobenzene-1,2-diol dehydrogenase [Hypsibius exemplaris]|uniref:Trans-1,2-dihydrobenzene-1,2-diol dehydrogenase n=1 Tax=Hypsibius exemplaris TaxID=2072580 RepID=A0A1W0WMH2_HYPEX|nr:Trans-1,2-dihydrobenzene-1,2-diol dehydrogenase [Hypsibius exemplaris]
MAVLRWGIAGAGSICDDFAAAVRKLPVQEHDIVAVGARDAGRAATFAQKFNIGKSYGSYKELSEDPNVDVVYVGTVNSTHYEVCKLMLAQNKHVLCEKTLTLLLKHTQELIRIAEEKKVFFQEAVWSRFFPAYRKLRDQVSSGAIGDVKSINITFCKKIAVEKRAVGSGTLFSLGIYPLQLIMAVCGPEMPEKIQACGTLNADGVDLTLAITLQYKNGTIAQQTTSFEIGPPDEAQIYGTKGTISFPKKFHAAMDMTINGTTETFPFPDSLVQNGLQQVKRPGFVYQAQEVRDCIQKGLLESPRFTHQETLTVSAIMEEVKRQIGLNYDSLYEFGDGH